MAIALCDVLELKRAHGEVLDWLRGSRVGETVGKGRPRAQRIITDKDPTQQQLADLFGIERYAPTC